ncbi:MAG: hypothetical protein HKN33_14775 [Pyrinomonadaceae bacterium]|nr:hypothetical protein [Pyrinomonadaceae bacterium]
MGLFDGKSPGERNKIIAAIVLGVLAVASLAYTFGPSILGLDKKVSTASATPTATPEASETPPPELTEIKRLPRQTEIDSEYASIPINYVGSGAFSVPVTGRNIFAFWEPGDPTPIPYQPPPTPDLSTPTPAPPIDYRIFLSFVTPQSTYAGSNSFRLEVNGDKFKPESRVLFNGTPLPTRYLSEQRLSATVPARLIANAFNAAIMVDTPGTGDFSRQVPFAVQAPPKPQFEYIGMIARQHYNNDTAYFQEKGARTGDPFSARLNDVVKGRFRVVSISEKEVEFQDTRLGFKHKLPLLRPKPGQGGTSSGSGYGDGPRPNSTRRIPGIPGNIRRVNPRRNPGRRNPTTRRTPRPRQDDPNSNTKTVDNE